MREPKPESYKLPRYQWPRVVGAVARHVGSTVFAERCLLFARDGRKPYTEIVAEALRHRHRRLLNVSTR